jgi:hypothetical protein
MAYNADPPYTKTPLTKEEKVLKPNLPSGMLPSGEANFFDVAQHHEHNDGSGINAIFPSPESFIVSGVGQSGAYQTYGPNPNLEVEDTSGIFSYNNLSGVFSNGTQSRNASGLIDFSFGGISAGSVTDFTGFNNYVHYYGELPPTTSINQSIIPIRIPYISDVTVAIRGGYDPYSVDNIGSLFGSGI